MSQAATPDNSQGEMIPSPCSHDFRYHDGEKYDGRARRICAKCKHREVEGNEPGNEGKWFKSFFMVLMHFENIVDGGYKTDNQRIVTWSKEPIVLPRQKVTQIV